MMHLLWLALAVPVIVHLFHRRRAKPVPFSTLRFLRMVDRRVARRQRLREWLLLALRLLLIAAILAALEKPVWRTSAMTSDSPVNVALVMDDSASMRAVSGGVSAFERARSAALALVGGLKRRDSVVFVNTGMPATVKASATNDLAGLQTRLSEMECGYGEGGMESALVRASNGAIMAEPKSGAIVLLTDMRRHAWAEKVDSIEGDLPRNFPVLVVDCGGELKKNAGIRDVEFSPGGDVAGFPAVIRCKVENTGAEAFSGTASLIVDDKKVEEEPVQVNSSGAAVVSFHHVFEHAGEAAGRVELSADDYDADNRRYFSVDVIEKLPVLIVDGAPSSVPRNDGIFFLRLALSGGRPDEESPVAMKVITADEIGQVRLNDYACVITADVGELDRGSASRLEDYVSNGGGLLVFSGPNMDAAEWNSAFSPGTMPVTLAEARFSENSFKVRQADMTHPALTDFGPMMKLDRMGVRTLLASTVADGDSRLLLEAENYPLLVERARGKGRVIFCATSCTTDWGSLPVRPLFVPLVHNLVHYLSGRAGGGRSCVAGEVYALNFSGAAPKVVKLTAPDAESAPGAKGTDEPKAAAVEVGGQTAQLGPLMRAGVYHAEYGAAGNVRNVGIAVNVPAAESDAERTSAGYIEGRLAQNKVIVVKDPAGLIGALRSAREGVPLWDYLLMAGLVLLVAESIFSNVVMKH